MKFAERKKRPSYGIAVLSLFLILVLTACGSGSSYQAASPSAEAKASYDGEAYADNYAAAEAAYDTADAAGGAEAGSHGEENATEPAESKQKLIYTCSMEIQTLTFAETAQKIHEVIRQYDGIIESESSTDSDYEWYKDESAKRRGTLSPPKSMRSAFPGLREQAERSRTAAWTFRISPGSTMTRPSILNLLRSRKRVFFR